MKSFFSKVDEKSAATFLVMMVALINQALTMAGHPIIDISTDQVNAVVAVVFTVATSVGGFFMNKPIIKDDGDDKSESQK
ncbi:phage holin [Lactiplantibacillus plantarum]|uniref:phage holin n=1 Tax=Lactiplantibacillus plantarum TaxID=1590 RepID=UPI00143D660E|nr:phage holin [Lactiplantibacillus plantarum]MBE1727390.1 hypothetical protein [Lactiplantibacillus plantarum]NKI39461.1 hypothetical protein [Lactiplantibacillus plantarum]